MHVFKAILFVSVLIYVLSFVLLAAGNELKFDLHTFAVNFLPMKAFVSVPVCYHTLHKYNRRLLESL